MTLKVFNLGSKYPYFNRAYVIGFCILFFHGCKEEEMLKKVTMKFHTQNCLTTTAVRIIDKAMLDSERAV